MAYGCAGSSPAFRTILKGSNNAKLLLLFFSDPETVLTVSDAPRWSIQQKTRKLLLGARRRILVFITRRLLTADMSTECVFGRISDCDEE